jgi:hypothetical protein
MHECKQASGGTRLDRLGDDARLAGQLVEVEVVAALPRGAMGMRGSPMSSDEVPGGAWRSPSYQDLAR